MPTTVTTIVVTWTDGATSTYTTSGTVSTSADGTSKTFVGRGEADTEDWTITVYLAHVRAWKQRSVTT